MASDGYNDWVAAGKPYSLARPCKELKALLKAAGYVVYDYPDDRHQLADPPEDHTPYAATGWPIASARWIGHAVDIMPGGGPLPLPTLMRRIIAARDARTWGTGWIKYLNWTDEQGRCWHESWKTGRRVTTASSDKGHGHISARSDYDASDIVSRSGWNPLEDGVDLDADKDFTALKWRVAALTGMTDVVDLHLKNADGTPRLEENELARMLRGIDTKLDLVIKRLGGSDDPITEAAVERGVAAAFAKAFPDALP